MIFPSPQSGEGFPAGADEAQLKKHLTRRIRATLSTLWRGNKPSLLHKVEKVPRRGG